MKKTITLLFATLFATAIYAAEITYPIELCDLNADGVVDVTDVTTLITTILK